MNFAIIKFVVVSVDGYLEMAMLLQSAGFGEAAHSLPLLLMR